jgi:nitroreductase
VVRVPIVVNTKSRRYMMFSELAEKRRSVRKYTSKPVEAEKIEAIVEAVLRSPTGGARRPWTFVVVTDEILRAKLSVAKPGGAAFLMDAPVAVVVCGDPSVSPLWVEDCSIAAVTIQYAARGLGLGSCWAHMKGNDFDGQTTSQRYIGGLLSLPDNLDILCIIAIGYAAEEPSPYKKDDLRYDKVSYNEYSQKKA